MKLTRLFLGLLGFLVAAPAIAGLDPATFQNLSFHQHPGAQLPLDAKIQDSAGTPVTLGSALAGRPSLLVLEYLRCRNLCSLVLSGAVHAISSSGMVPGRDLDLVAISIDPRENAHDAASAAAMYARRFPDPRAAQAGVRFFTASPADVRKIASAIGFAYRYDPATNQFAHPAGFVVTTPDGRISRYMLGINPQPALLRSAVVEAGRGELEPAAHPFLLLCFGYDPDEGTVAALAMRLVRLVSVATIIGCIALIAFLSFRRRSA